MIAIEWSNTRLYTISALQCFMDLTRSKTREWLRPRRSPKKQPNSVWPRRVWCWNWTIPSKSRKSWNWSVSLSRFSRTRRLWRACLTLHSKWRNSKAPLCVQSVGFEARSKRRWKKVLKAVSGPPLKTKCCCRISSSVGHGTVSNRNDFIIRWPPFKRQNSWEPPLRSRETKASFARSRKTRFITK